ncbi:MAG: translation initiation factor IF-6 [Candidatus Diapherotrites archaeon]
MRIEKKAINGSPFIGVFASVTEKIALLPKTISARELRGIEELLEVEAIQASIADSDLIGILAKGNSKGFIVPEIIEEGELRELEGNGVKIKVIQGINALGNLIALNDFGGIMSPLMPEGLVQDIKRFFGIEFIRTLIANTEIAGSCIVASNKGFVVHPNVTQKEFNLIKKALKVKGTTSTANYGNPFIANDVIANSKGALIGEQTSPHEMLRIDEGLSGEE